MERLISNRLTVGRRLAVLRRVRVGGLRRPFPVSFSSSAPSLQVPLVEVCAEGKVREEGSLVLPSEICSCSPGLDHQTGLG